MTWALLSCVVPPWAEIEKKGRVVKDAEVKKGLAGKKKKKKGLTEEMEVLTWT